MENNFNKCLKLVLLSEGSFVNHPADPGGATNKGVTQAVYDDWRNNAGQPKQSVRHITDAEVSAIYRRNYWDKVRGDDLPCGLDYAVFDFAVNSGVSRAARYLQACVGTAQDGVVGPKTIATITDTAETIHALCERRRSFLMQLPTFPTFGRGWMRRINRVEQDAKDMVA